jgi:hypothetical protein
MSIKAPNGARQKVSPHVGSGLNRNPFIQFQQEDDV